MLYAQLDANRVCRSVSRLKGKVERADMIPIPDLDQRLLGRLYTSGQFLGLAVSAPKTVLAVDEIVTITVAWVDLDGQVCPHEETVTARAAGGSVDVTMPGGQGEFDFSADVPGTYTIVVSSGAGVVASLEVSVQ